MASCPTDLRDRLANCPADVPVFNLAGQAMYARLLEIHDGDSPKLVIEVAGKLYKVMTRLVGVDTPEINSKDPKEKALAVRARNYVANWAMPDRFHEGGTYTEKDIKGALWRTAVIVYVKCGAQDKYGRLLAELYTSCPSDERSESLNERLVEQGYGDSYDGGRKTRSWASP